MVYILIQEILDDVAKSLASRFSQWSPTVVVLSIDVGELPQSFHGAEVPVARSIPERGATHIVRNINGEFVGQKIPNYIESSALASQGHGAISEVVDITTDRPSVCKRRYTVSKSQRAVATVELDDISFPSTCGPMERGSTSTIPVR
jgi:hypothetical protein